MSRFREPSHIFGPSHIFRTHFREEGSPEVWPPAPLLIFSAISVGRSLRCCIEVDGPATNSDALKKDLLKNLSNCTRHDERKDKYETLRSRERGMSD